MKTREARDHIVRLKSQGCLDPIEASAKKYGLPLEFVCAIASRETGCDNKPSGYLNGVFHFVGVIPVSIRHEIAQLAMADRTWKDEPAPLIDFACSLLVDFLEGVPKSHDKYMRLALAAKSYREMVLRKPFVGYAEYIMEAMSAFRRALGNEDGDE